MFTVYSQTYDELSTMEAFVAWLVPIAVMTSSRSCCVSMVAKSPSFRTHSIRASLNVDAFQWTTRLR